MHRRGEHISVVSERATTGGIAKYMQRMPLVVPEEIEWTHICKDIMFRHRVIARLNMILICVLLLGTVAVAREWVLLLINPIVAAGLIAGKITHNDYVVWAGFCAWMAIFFINMKRNYGHIVAVADEELGGHDNRSDMLEAAVIKEEIWCREGAETWNWRQRFKSVWLFAVAHSITWWYGVGILLMMPFVGGMVCMLVYLRAYRLSGSRHTALQESAMVHYYHNKKIVRPLSVVLLCITCMGCVLILTFL